MPGYGTPRAPLSAMIQLISISNPSFRRFFAPAVAAIVLSAGVANAQRRPVPVKPGNEQTTQSRRDPIVPPGYAPPAGMCRIWIKDVPPSQQPAPTDCASAVRNRPANGRVLFGDDAGKAKKGKANKKSSNTDGLVDLITRGISR